MTAVPDFLAGFVLGMTADNHLGEIEACVEGGELLSAEIRTGIADIKHGGLEYDLDAVFQFGLMVMQVPHALKTCESMGDDIAAIEQWAQIFKNPKELAARVSKHYLLHKKQIKTDVAALEADWSQALYFRAGVDLADLMTVAVGPIEEDSYQAF